MSRRSRGSRTPGRRRAAPPPAAAARRRQPPARPSSFARRSGCGCRSTWCAVPKSPLRRRRSRASRRAGRWRRQGRCGPCGPPAGEYRRQAPAAAVSAFAPPAGEVEDFLRRLWYRISEDEVIQLVRLRPGVAAWPDCAADRRRSAPASGSGPARRPGLRVNRHACWPRVDERRVASS